VQCALCPAAAYCLGGAVPATSCGPGLYSPPGSDAAAACAPATFVVVTAALPLLRQDFDEGAYLGALAGAAGCEPRFVLIQVLVIV
jgi:hypothetical protein